MSVILDALKKAQEERKGPVYRNGGGDEGTTKRSRWVFYLIVGAGACAILLVLFLPNLYRMQVPDAPQVAQQRPVLVPPPSRPKAASEAPAVNPPEVPVKEEFSKFAVAPRAGVTEFAQLEKKVMRKAPGPEARMAKKGPEAGSQKPESRPEKVEETKDPVMPAPGATVVVKRMTDDRIVTNYNNAIRAAEQGNTEEAKKLYLAVLADQPNNIEALNNLGVLAMREDDTKEAAFYFRRILEYRKDYAKAYNNLGIMAMRDGGKRIAEEYFRKAIEVAPDGAEPYLNLAALLRSEKRLEEASRVVDALVKRGLRGAQLYLSAALIKDELGQYEEAIKYYRYYLQVSSPKEDRRKVVERLTFLEESKAAADH